MKQRLRVALKTTIFFAAIAVTGIGYAADQAYPQRVITLLVGYPPGGSTDLVARTLGQALSSRIGQPVVIENLGGAGGSIAAQKVALSAPDGYTLLVGANNEIAINALVKKSVRYSIGDFTPIGLLGTQPLVLTTTPAKHIATAAELLQQAKAHPDTLTYGSSGVGTSLHVAAEMVKQQGGVTMVHIPYRGTGALTTDLLGGSLDVGVYVLSSALPMIRSGKLVAIGTTQAKRSPITPDIPALSETPALKAVDIDVWFALLGPANLPPPILTKLKSALAEAMASPEYQKSMTTNGSVVPDHQPDLKTFFTTQIDKYKKIVQFANIKDE